MRVLALDTTTREGSVAVVEDGRIVAERGGDAERTHAARLPTEILALLHDVDLALPAIDVFAVAAGPGSFTGLRVGIATIQGLSFVQHRPVVAVSALEALAHAGSAELRPGARVGAWMDAHRREIFSALYEVRDSPMLTANRLVELDPAAVGNPAATIERWDAGGPIEVFIGDGAMLNRTLLAGRGQVIAGPLLAGTIGLMAVHRALAGLTVDPAGLHPLYVRRPYPERNSEEQGALGS